MTPPKITVEFVSSSAFVRGRAARGLVLEAGGRPMFSRARSAWATSAQIASDVLALCDRRNIPVVIERGGEDD